MTAKRQSLRLFKGTFDKLIAFHSKNLTPVIMEKNDAYWREKLTPEQYRILRQKGTERPWTGPFLENTEKGVYECAGCGSALFSSDTKFDSHCGWPSFYEPINSTAIAYHRDISYGMVRTEVTCSACGGHLGHVFDDGPAPTGQRYCINGVALGFDKKH